MSGTGTATSFAPIKLIEEHPKLNKIRGKSPDEVDLLTKSMARTGKTCMLPPLRLRRGRPRRTSSGTTWRTATSAFRAAIANKLDALTCMTIARWRTAEDALRESVQLLYARHEHQDRDLLSLAKIMPIKDMMEFTGKSESTLSRFATVAQAEWFLPPIEDGVIGYSTAARLLKACNKNPDKLEALETTLREKHEWAKGRPGSGRIS